MVSLVVAKTKKKKSAVLVNLALHGHNFLHFGRNLGHKVEYEIKIGTIYFVGADF